MSKPVLDCEHCKKTFTTLSNLKRHQATVKKCLLIQGKSEPDKIFNCEFCEYKTGIKANHKKHLETCRGKKEHEIKEKENLRRELDIKNAVMEVKDSLIEELKQAVLAPKVINNTSNTMNITLERQMEFDKKILDSYIELKHAAKEFIEKRLTERIFRQGVDGIIRFIANDMLSYDNKIFYICHDKSGDFHRKIEDQIDIDVKAKQLLNDIYPLIKIGCNRIAKNLSKELIEELENTNLQEEKNDIDDQLNEIMSIQREISKLEHAGTKERDRCVKILISTCFMSKTNLKYKMKQLSIEEKEGYVIKPRDMEELWRKIGKDFNALSDEEITNYINPKNKVLLLTDFLLKYVDYKYDNETGLFSYTIIENDEETIIRESDPEILISLQRALEKTPKMKKILSGSDEIRKPYSFFDKDLFFYKNLSYDIKESIKNKI